MGKIIVLILAIVLFIPSIVSAEDPCLKGTNFTSSSVVYTGRTHICQIFITTDKTNDCAVQCYDATTSTGTTEVGTALTCMGANGTCLGTLNYLVNRLYCTVTTGGTCTVGISKYDDNR